MKTNYLRFSLFAMVAAAFMVGCSQEEVLDMESGQQEGQALTISATSVGFEASNAETRVSEQGAQTLFEDGDQMGLYVIENPGADNAKIILRNVALTYQNGAWSANRTIYYYKNSDYIAYFPYKADLASDIKATEVEAKIKEVFDANLAVHKTDQSDKAVYHAADLMTAKIDAATLANQGGTTKELNFSLKHSYSMIELSIPIHRFYYTVGADATTRQVNYDVPMREFTLNLTDGGVTEAEVIPYHLGDGIYRCLVTPGEIQVKGSFTDPEDLRPVEFANTNAKNNLDAGAYVRYNISYNGVDGQPVNFERKERSIIGDYYCQDGSIYPSIYAVESIPDNVVGIIFAKVGADDFTGEKAGTYSHYVLSAKQRGKMKFRSDPVDAADKANIAGIPNISSASQEDFFNNYISAMDGWSSTQVLAGENFNITTDIEKNWSSHKDFKISEDIKTSGWFIPSIGQWIKLQELLNQGSEPRYTYSKSNDKVEISSDTKGAVQKRVEELILQLNNTMKYNTMITYMENSTEKSGGAYWSCTQDEEVAGDPSTSKLYCLDMNKNKFVIIATDKSSTQRVLCPILAF